MRFLKYVLLMFILSLWPVSAQKHKTNEEPKPQILPLPPEPPMAVAAGTDTLDFHISPLTSTGGLSAQIRQSLNNLLRDTHGETIVKLRAFVAGTGDARRVQAQVAQLFTEHKLPLPVLSILEVGALEAPGEQVVIEAVVSTHRVVNPNGLAFFFGQSAPSLTKAVQRLKASVGAAAVPADHVQSLTCFTSETGNFTTNASGIRGQFPNTGVNIVQSVRDPQSEFTQCEAVGQLTSPPKAVVEHLSSANATLVNAPQLIFTGLQLSFGSYHTRRLTGCKRRRGRSGAIRPRWWWTDSRSTVSPLRRCERITRSHPDSLLCRLLKAFRRLMQPAAWRRFWHRRARRAPVRML
jgi:hypothetical protein